MPVLAVSRHSVIEDLERVALDTRVFISMPCVPGITPRALVEKGVRKDHGDGLERLHGIFKVDDIGLPAFDHGVLYGDAVFEGLLVVQGRLFQWREHLERLYASAARLSIEVPYSPLELTEHVMEAVKSTSFSSNEHSYIRLVVTRGIGDMGIHPAKCAGSTLYAIISTIQLYPEAVYHRGIRLSLAKKTRRAGAEVLDPQIKSCNYLNNISALLETLPEGCNETVMLTSGGFIAEATADNLFIVVREDGWESSPAKVTLLTPSSNYCLRGITRGLVLGHAKKLGFNVVESTTLLPQDFAGTEREVFLTGTAAGVVPVVAIDGGQIGDGRPGLITSTLRDLLSADMRDPAMALSVSAWSNEISEYLDTPGFGTGARPTEDGPAPGNLVIRLFDKVDSRDWEGLRQVFCQDATYERPGYEPLMGLERVMKFYREERVIASGKHHLENIVLEENSGACWGRFTGVHKNGSAIDERFADVYRIKNGKIWNRQSYFFRPAV
jgi:branched-chain amino acid aminotransferase